MVSLSSVRQDLATAQGAILIMMQEGDSEHGFVNAEWADEMYEAYDLVKRAGQALGRAESYEAGN